MGQRSREVNRTVQPSLTPISTTDASKSFGDVIDRAADGERFVVTRHERERVVVLSKRDYDRLLELAGFEPAPVATAV